MHIAVEFPANTHMDWYMDCELTADYVREHTPFATEVRITAASKGGLDDCLRCGGDGIIEVPDMFAPKMTTATCPRCNGKRKETHDSRTS